MARAARTDWFVVDDLAGAVRIAAGRADVLVVDLENTLVGYDSTVEARRTAMEAAVDSLTGSGLHGVAFVSNARFELPPPRHETLAVHAVAGARKPHVRLPPLRSLRTLLAGAAVYGDQPLTDGRLARNLGGIWIQPRHAHRPAATEPLWPRVMRRAGRRLLDRRFALTPDPDPAREPERDPGPDPAGHRHPPP